MNHSPRPLLVSLLLLSACHIGKPSAAAETPLPARSQAATPSSADSSRYRIPAEGAPSRGSAQALVTVVEFVDFQCPFSRRSMETVDALLQRYGGQLRYVFRMQPLPFHAQARGAALAALAAAEQGRYWEMSQKLFANPSALDDPGLDRLAGEAGLDVERFNSDRDSDRIVGLLDRDTGLAHRLGVGGTPTFFINGVMIAGSQPPEELANVIDPELARAKSLLASGVAIERLYEAEVAHGLESAPDDPQRGSTCTEPGCPGSMPAEVEVGHAPSRGDASAPVTLVVFSDFDEPFSAKFQTTLRSLEHQYPGKLRIVAKQFPMPFDADAPLAARAAFAAEEQGKYWEYHDLLFAHPDEHEHDQLIGYARQLGLDAHRFRESMDGPATQARLSSDVEQATRLGVEGVPTTFVNGTRFSGAYPVPTFTAVIDRILR